ncbi:MAG: head GIN domain-containing protein [Eudoraea sp.]|uniref:head GIN domain-containing protein n=1 Tax=Eudoraea sp. TaxID=1979955 RepID=UPI003C74F2A4
MKKVFLLICAIILTTGLRAQWGKKIKGNGDRTTVERSTSDYDAVAVSGWFDVNLVEGEEGQLILEGESNLLEHIKTEVKDGKLVIKVAKGVNLKPSSWNKDGGIYITVPVESINEVTLSGSGDIVGEKTIETRNFSTNLSGSGDITLALNAEEVSAAMSGSGDINLSGKTINFEVKISGSGDIKAYDLIADNVKASISGSADISVTANEMLTARVSGSGDIRYKGDPKKIDTKSSGSGDITKG